MPADPPADLLGAVRDHLGRTFGAPAASASVTFLGTEPIEVLRFGPDAAGLVHYATVGASRRAMHPPTAAVIDRVRGPRAELVLSLRPPRDDVLRALAVIASTPAVDGVVLAAGVRVELGTPLWAGAGATAVRLGEAGTPVPDLDLVAGGQLPDLDGVQPVRFYPVRPEAPEQPPGRFTAGRRAPDPAAG